MPALCGLGGGLPTMLVQKGLRSSLVRRIVMGSSRSFIASHIHSFSLFVFSLLLGGVQLIVLSILVVVPQNRMKTTSSGLVAAAVAFAQAGSALKLNVADAASIKSAASQVAKGLYVFHNEAATTGQFNQPQPWFWWLSGSGWTGLMDYTVYTKDTTYKADLLSALAKNVGPNFDFVPREQSWEANDDQVR